MNYVSLNIYSLLLRGFTIGSRDENNIEVNTSQF